MSMLQLGLKNRPLFLKHLGDWDPRSQDMPLFTWPTTTRESFDFCLNRCDA